MSYPVPVSGLVVLDSLNNYALTLKAPVRTAADDIHKYFSLFFRENKTKCFK